jgi:hypothetical protein
MAGGKYSYLAKNREFMAQKNNNYTNNLKANKTLLFSRIISVIFPNKILLYLF